MNGAITSKPGWHSWILCSAARGGGAGRRFGVLWKGLTPRARLDARERKGAESCQPPGVKCPHRAPDRRQIFARGEERASLAHGQRLGQFCETPRPRSGALARVPACVALTSVQVPLEPRSAPLSEAPRGHRAHSRKFSPSLCSQLAEPREVKAAPTPLSSSEARPAAATPFYELLGPPRPARIRP